MCLQITNLDLDTLELDALTWSNIATVLRQSIESPVPDFEYAQNNGLLHIPRLFEDPHLISEISRADQVLQAVEGPLFQDNRPLKMVLREPGLLNTLQFVDDEGFRKPLKPDYVEIQVSCTGMFLLLFS